MRSSHSKYFAYIILGFVMSYITINMIDDKFGPIITAYLIIGYAILASVFAIYKIWFYTYGYGPKDFKKEFGICMTCGSKTHVEC